MIDDYVIKPFSPKALMARINAVVNRNKPKEKVYIYKNLKVDYLGHSLTINNKDVKITPKEYDLLTFFIKLIFLFFS